MLTTANSRGEGRGRGRRRVLHSRVVARRGLCLCHALDGPLIAMQTFLKHFYNNAPSAVARDGDGVTGRRRGGGSLGR